MRQESGPTAVPLSGLLAAAEERQNWARENAYVPGLMGLTAEYFRPEPPVSLQRLLSIDDAAHRLKAIEEVVHSNPAGLGALEGGVRQAIDSVAEQRADLADVAQLARITLLARLGQQQAEDATGLAHEAAEHVRDPCRQAEAPAGLARALADSGDLEEAERVALLVDEPRWRAVALAHVACTLARHGRVPDARQVVTLARSAADVIVGPPPRAEAWAGVACALAESGDPAQRRQSESRGRCRQRR